MRVSFIGKLDNQISAAVSITTAGRDETTQLYRKIETTMSERDPANKSAALAVGKRGYTRAREFQSPAAIRDLNFDQDDGVPIVVDCGRPVPTNFCNRLRPGIENAARLAS